MRTPGRKRASHKHLLGAAALTAWGISIVGAFVLVVLLAPSALRDGQMAAVISSTLVTLTNEDRKEQQLSQLTISPLLTSAAQAKADDMAQKGYFAHISPEGYGSWHWFSLVGYSFTHAGENLAVNFSDSEEVEKAWMRSPTHRANILNGQFTEIGIATAVGEYKGKKTVFVVQMFGTPAYKPGGRLTESIPADPESMAYAARENTGVLGAAASMRSEELPFNLDSLLASPEATLKTTYLVFAGVLLIILAVVTGFEWRRGHMRHVYAVLVLILVMTALFVIADRFVLGEPTIGQLQVGALGFQKVAS